MNLWTSIGLLGRSLIYSIIMLALIGIATCANATTRAATHCSWDKPGANPYRGDVPAAVENYKDIPVAVRAKLRERMERRKPDDIAVIRRDSITSSDAIYGDLQQMHFGNGRLCDTVSRAKWKESHEEVGLIYCEDIYCVIVPTVCNNVSRVMKRVEAVLPPVFARPVIPPGGDFSGPVIEQPPAFGHPEVPPPPYMERPEHVSVVLEPPAIVCVIIGGLIILAAMGLNRHKVDHDVTLDADKGIR